jgi:hypothetical protein
MEINATTSVTKPAVAQSATTTRDVLGRFTSFSAPPVLPFSSADPFQLEPFHVKSLQVSRFHDDRAPTASKLGICPT